jgi:ribosomal protein L29
MAHEEMAELRRRIAALSTDELRTLSPEDLAALAVTLRDILEKIEAIRSGYRPGDNQEWDRLTT